MRSRLARVQGLGIGFGIGDGDQCRGIVWRRHMTRLDTAGRETRPQLRGRLWTRQKTFDRGARNRVERCLYLGNHPWFRVVQQEQQQLELIRGVQAQATLSGELPHTQGNGPATKQG